MRKWAFQQIVALDHTYSGLYSGLLIDKRNTIFVLVSAILLLTVLPSALWLFYSFTVFHGAIHLFLVMIVFAETFMAMLHNASHKSLFRPECSALNLVIPYILCVLFGQSWGTYYYHHVKHHHVEDNGVSDLSSTSAYHRDSFFSFLLYFFRFFLLVQIELPLYFLRKCQYSNAFKTLFGELGSFFVFGTIAWLAPRPAIFVFVIPFLLMRFFMMAANWGQHAFINNRVKNAHSLTIVQSSYNLLAFNDGFHASHHENSQRHWSEHPTAPVAFGASLDKITFSGDVNFGDIWLLLMLKNFDELERMLVFDDVAMRPSKADVIRELKRQLMPQ